MPDDINELKSQLQEAWRKAASQTYPLAVDAEIVGESEDQFMATAAASHERIAAKVEEASKARIREVEERLKKSAWGGGTGGPQGGATGKPAWQTRVDSIWQAIREGTLRRGDAEALGDLRLSDILQNSETTSETLKAWARSGKQGFGRQ